MPREACPRILHRCTTALISGTVALTLAASPSMAQAGQPQLPAASMATGMSPTAAKLRTIMSLQDPADDLGAPASEAPAPVAEGAPPIAAAGPAPAPAPAPTQVGPEPSRGLGMLIPGAIITGALGLPITTLGVIRLVQYNNIQKQTNDDGVAVVAAIGKGASIAVITFGVIFLSVGVPLLAVGAVKLSKYQKWKNGHAMVPAMNRTAHGTWTAGLALRF